WLKGLLAPPQECPQWAFFAHTLISEAALASPVVKPRARISSFLQTWSPSLKKLSPHLNRIIKTAKIYNIRWEAISINNDIARRLPVWFHIGASNNLNKLNNHSYATCLREKHAVTSVGQLENITARQSPLHRQNKACTCKHCDHDRTSFNCKKPFKCAKLANEILKCILPKWHPKTCTNGYSLIISPEQIPPENNPEEKTEFFDPTFPSPESLKDGFRAFVTSKQPCTSSAIQSPITPGDIPHLTTITITSSHRINRDRNYVSGGGAFFGQDDARNLSVNLPE
ncbi:uncharacterized protein F5147DRAFT_583770, partial [Suillus discolor]